MRPTSFMSPMLAMPTAIVVKMIGAISIRISLMKPSPSGRIAAPRVRPHARRRSRRARCRPAPGRTGSCTWRPLHRRASELHCARKADDPADGATGGSRSTLVVGCWCCVYNANGREIGSYDSQPTKFAAREFLLRGHPHPQSRRRRRAGQYAERSAFVRALTVGTVPRTRRFRPSSPPPSRYPLTRDWRHQSRSARDRCPPMSLRCSRASLLTAAGGRPALSSRRAAADRAAGDLSVALGLGLGTGLVVARQPDALRTRDGSLRAWRSPCLRPVLRVTTNRPTHHRVLAAIGRIGAGRSSPGRNSHRCRASCCLGVCVPDSRGARRSRASRSSRLSRRRSDVRLRQWFGDPLGWVALVLQQNSTSLVHSTRGWIDWTFRGILPSC